MRASPETFATEPNPVTDETSVDMHEAIKEPSGVEVRLDRNKLSDLYDRAPDGAKPVIEALLKMPEQLNFQPGATIIVGENGAGKSTIAKAIYFARLLAQGGKYEGEGVQSLEDLRPESEEYLLLQSSGPLVAELVPAITVNTPPPTEDESNYVEYVDYGRLHGRAAQAREDQEASRMAGSVRVDKYGNGITIEGGQKASVPKFESKSNEVTGRLGRRTSLGISGSKGKDYLSARQSIDDGLADRVRSSSSLHGNGDKLIVHDEPEVGLSPRRQMEELRNTILIHSGEGATAIVATNSVALYMDQTLPRIDLDFPERGIFTLGQVPTNS